MMTGTRARVGAKSNRVKSTRIVLLTYKMLLPFSFIDVIALYLHSLWKIVLFCLFPHSVRINVARV